MASQFKWQMYWAASPIQSRCISSLKSPFCTILCDTCDTILCNTVLISPLAIENEDSNKKPACTCLVKCCDKTKHFLMVKIEQHSTCRQHNECVNIMTSSDGNIFRVTVPLRGIHQSSVDSSHKGTVTRDFDVLCCQSKQIAEQTDDWPVILAAMKVIGRWRNGFEPTRGPCNDTLCRTLYGKYDHSPWMSPLVGFV